MKTLTLLLLAFTLQLPAGAHAAEATNAPLDNEKSVRAGTIIVTQNGYPLSAATSVNRGTVAEEWMIPVLKLIIWPSLIASVVWFFRKEIRHKLLQVTTARAGQNLAVEFAPDMREQIGRASCRER